LKQALFQSAQHIYEKREGSGSVPLNNGSGSPTLIVSTILFLQMLEKMEKEGRLEQEQEAMLYLLVVELRQDWRAARDLLAGPLGQILENSPSCYLRCISKVTMFSKTPMHSFMKETLRTFLPVQL
jgi:hypothetical protein